jgi:hypothetical protein
VSPRFPLKGYLESILYKPLPQGFKGLAVHPGPLRFTFVSSIIVVLLTAGSDTPLLPAILDPQNLMNFDSKGLFQDVLAQFKAMIFKSCLFQDTKILNLAGFYLKLA